jgi:hypothetical protein
MSKKSIGLARCVQSRDVRNGVVTSYASMSLCAKKFGMTQVQLTEHLRSVNASKRTWKWHVFRYESDSHLPWPDLDPVLAIEYSMSLKEVRLYVVEHKDGNGVQCKKVLPWLEDVKTYIGNKTLKLDKLSKARTINVNGVDFRCRVATREELLENSEILSETSRVRSNRLCASYIRDNHPASVAAAVEPAYASEGSSDQSSSANSLQDAFSILTQLGRQHDTA